MSDKENSGIFVLSVFKDMYYNRCGFFSDFVLFFVIGYVMFNEWMIFLVNSFSYCRDKVWSIIYASGQGLQVHASDSFLLLPL